jgi:hypothetical protein
MSVVVVISQHLLNVFVQLANKRGFKKKKKTLNSQTKMCKFLPDSGVMVPVCKYDPYPFCLEEKQITLLLFLCSFI